MDEARRRKILDEAMDLFRKKGYSAASMQEIAEACGMAKASIYKFFPSKEDLFTAAFVDCHRTLLEQADELDRSGSRLNLSPKEKLRRKIEFQLYYTVENHLFMIDFRELPITSNENFAAAWKRKKAALLAWRKELLLEAYGERIEPFVWDAVAIFRGILFEYLGYVIQKVIAVPIPELAAYIVDRMDAVTEDLARSNAKPILNEANAYYHHLNPSDPLVRQGTVRQFLQSLVEKIGELPKDEEARGELREVVSLLRKEAEANDPNPTLIRVLSSYLESVPELRPYVRQLNLMLG